MSPKEAGGVVCGGGEGLGSMKSLIHQVALFVYSPESFMEPHSHMVTGVRGGRDPAGPHGNFFFYV